MSDQNNRSVSRRKFLQDATKVTVGGLAVSVLAGCASPTETATDQPVDQPASQAATAEPCPTCEPCVQASGLPETWDKEADVVIVGFGGAGAAAALEANKAGAKVLLLERMENGGGSTAICGGLTYMGGGTPLQQACGFEDTRDNMYNYLMAAVGEGADAEKIGLFCDKSVELYNWLTDLGLNYQQSYFAGKASTPPTTDGLCYTGNEAIAEFTAVATSVPRGHHAPGEGSSGPALFAPLQAAVDGAGIEVSYKTLAKKLITNSDGRVVGVVVDNDGTEQVIKANKAVVLTAGTYHANLDMVKQYNPAWAVNENAYVGTPGDDGSGIRMGQALGADLDHIGTVTGFGGVYLFSEEFTKGILVNQAGRRYIGEDGYGSRVGIRVVERFPNSFIVVDSAIWANIPDAIKKTVEQMTFQGNTVAELAAATGLPAPMLESTVKDYNAMAAAGADLEFQKNAHYLAQLTEAPFYAIAWGPWIVIRQSLGGLKVNIDAQVLDTAGQVIPGLYSAGANTAGIISRFYPGSGTATAQAFIFGRIAGVKAAAETAWGEA